MRTSRLSGQSSQEALESLYRLHVREIYGYALALLDSADDAEDATQATFMNAYRALDRGERPRNAARWLRAIALNVCRQHFRRASRRPAEVSLDEDPGDLVAESPAPAIGDVIKAMSHLPFNQRAALIMREFEGRSLPEIAGLLGVTKPAVEATLFRARRALREQLEASLLCDEAERAISRQLDDGLSRSERRALRAHLRQCPECASLARRVRAQRSTLKSLSLVPLPVSLAWERLARSGIGVSSAPTSASLMPTTVAPVALKLIGATVLASVAVSAGYATLGRHSAVASTRIAARAVASVPVAGLAMDATRLTTQTHTRAHGVSASGLASARSGGHNPAAGHKAPGHSARGRNGGATRGDGAQRASGSKSSGGGTNARSRATRSITSRGNRYGRPDQGTRQTAQGKRMAAGQARPRSSGRSGDGTDGGRAARVSARRATGSGRRS